MITLKTIFTRAVRVESIFRARQRLAARWSRAGDVTNIFSAEGDAIPKALMKKIQCQLNNHVQCTERRRHVYMMTSQKEYRRACRARTQYSISYSLDNTALFRLHAAIIIRYTVISAQHGVTTDSEERLLLSLFSNGSSLPNATG